MGKAHDAAVVGYAVPNSAGGISISEKSEFAVVDAGGCSQVSTSPANGMCVIGRCSWMSPLNEIDNGIGNGEICHASILRLLIHIFSYWEGLWGKHVPVEQRVKRQESVATLTSER